MRQDLIKPFIENDAPIQKQFEQVKSYLYQFREQVEMMLQNIDVDNMAPQLAEPLDLLRNGSKTLSVSGNGSRVDINILSDMIKTRVLESTEFGQIESSITQMASEIALKVSSGDLTAQFLIGKLNSGSTYATINADRISLEGYTTINNSFSIDNSGSVEMNGGNINIDADGDFDGRVAVNYLGMIAQLAPGRIVFGDSSSSRYSMVSGADSGSIAMLAVNSNTTKNVVSYHRYSETGFPMGTTIGDDGSNVTIKDGASTMQAQWRMLSDVQNYNYVLVGVAT